MTKVCTHKHELPKHIYDHYSNHPGLFFPELPKPQLGDLSDLKSLSMKVRRERTPNILGFNYSELCDLDLIKLEVIPEKKGLILKHVEYEVTSQVGADTLTSVCLTGCPINKFFFYIYRLALQTFLLLINKIK